MKIPSQNINGILLSLKNGERWAFREIFDTYRKKLYYFVFSIAKSDSATEDILQEVFIKVWEKRETIDLSASFDSFIYTIARNLSYNHLRAVANQESLKKEVWRNLKYYNQQTEDIIQYAEYQDIVNHLLEHLPVKKRNIFILSKQHGRSNQEIADLLNISPKTVKNHLWKTLQIIRLQLQPYITDTIMIFLLIFSLI